jgi:ribose transport system substrate-binding protein
MTTPAHSSQSVHPQQFNTLNHMERKMTGHTRRSKHRRAWGIAVLGVLATVTIAACSSSASSSSNSGSSATSSATAASGSHKYKMVFIPLGAGVGFYETMNAGGAAEAAKLGIGWTYDAPSQFGIAQQNTVIEAACGNHPSAVLIAPIDPNATRAAIQQCISDGVAVSTIDTGLNNTSGLVSTDTSDNKAGGAAAADFVCKEIHDSGTVVPMGGGAPLTTSTLRFEGFAAEMAKACPNVKVMTIQYPANAGADQSDVQSLISANPSIKAFFTSVETTVTPMAHGLAVDHDTGKILLVGYDAGSDEVSLMKAGQLQAMVAQQPALEAVTTVKLLYAALQSGKLQPAQPTSILTPNVLITAQTLNADKQYLYLP